MTHWRRPLHFLAVLGVLLAGWAAPPPLAQAANLDTIADDVLGQADFTHNAANAGGLNASGLNVPESMALDAHGNLYVADIVNNRVLEYDAPLTTHQAASRVFGQPDFTHNTYNNGGTSATSLANPNAVALDGQGNLYVVDSGNQRVLEFDAPLSSSMAASRVFGQGGSFSTATVNKGGLSASSLYFPLGLALDIQGNLYVADSGNNRVLEYDTPLSSGLTADRVIGEPGFISNTADTGGRSASSLNYPTSVAVDTHGDLYVSDNSNNRVLEFDAALTTGASAARVFGQGGSFTTATVNKGGLSAVSLYGPSSLSLDAKDDLYVADPGNHRVLEYNTPLGSGVSADRVFGQGGVFNTGTANKGGLGPSSLNQAQGVAVGPGGSLFVADSGNYRVLEYDLPVPRGLPALTAISPATVATGSPDFTLTVTGAGFYGGSVVRWNGSDRATTFLNSTLLTATISAADLSGGGPFAVTVFTPAPGGGISSLINLALYVRVGHDTAADTEQGQASFVVNGIHHLPAVGANDLSRPSSLALDVHSGRLFVADAVSSRVLSWPNAAALANGQAADLVLGQPNFVATAANTGWRSARSLSGPEGVALDGQGNLYVADTNNNRVLEYDAPLSSGMAASRVFGQGGSFISATPNNGGVSANSLYEPAGVALDAQGNLYVTDFGNERVLVYNTPLSADTTADRVFGQPDFAQSAPNNGGRSATSLSLPGSVALDALGDLYIADRANNRVLEYNPPLTTHQAASRVFGQPGFSTGTANNGGLGAGSLSFPKTVALDGWGNLYVADTNNNRVLEFDGPLTNATADRVFGQPTFLSNDANHGGVSANSLDNPTGVALDAQSNLYVTDDLNSRVLEFDWALVTIQLPLVVR